MEVLGIDIGGSGIKGAVVDTKTGTLTIDRFRLETPQPATPDAVIQTAAAVATHFAWEGKPIGCGFPGVMKDGVVHTAANIDKEWIGKNAEQLLSAASGGARVRVLNDADVAGLAEMRFGAGKNVNGIVVMITLGTGIGTALFWNGTLIPNAELGHIGVKHHEDAERWAAESAREREDLKWGEWAGRVDAYLHKLEDLLWPDLFIVGGGVSKKGEKFLPHLTTRTPVVLADLRNEAGIVGAALAAAEGAG